jgi:hypothetical protein
MVEVLQQIALKDGSEVLALDQETHWRLKDALERARFGSKLRDGRFRGRTSTPVFAMARTATSCTNSTDALRPALCEQVGGEQRRFDPLSLPDAGDQYVRGGVGHLVEPALQRGGCRLGVEAGVAILS